MKRYLSYTFLFTFMLLLLGLARPATAQEGTTETAGDLPPLSLFTAYPSQIVGPDEAITIPFTLRVGSQAQIVTLSVTEMPENWTASFKGGNQFITSAYVEPGNDVNVDLRLTAPAGVEAGDYAFTVMAEGDRTQAEELQADATLTAEVVGESSISLTTPDGRLSGPIQAGEDVPITLLLQNTGSAPATNIQLTSSQPTGWKVDFNPKTVDQLEPNSQIEVVATVQSTDSVIAGDYVLTFRAQPKDSTTESVEYRATVRTSTLWGIGGVVLIAVAIGGVGLAVSRFGRR